MVVAAAPARQAKCWQPQLPKPYDSSKTLRGDTADTEARKILEFQIEFLNDPALLEPAEGQFAEGLDASHAWCTAIDTQIADFEARWR